LDWPVLVVVVKVVLVMVMVPMVRKILEEVEVRPDGTVEVPLLELVDPES
jgi:hypothetical protein